jgi:hypothetical protein
MLDRLSVRTEQDKRSCADTKSIFCATHVQHSPITIKGNQIMFDIAGQDTDCNMCTTKLTHHTFSAPRVAHVALKTCPLRSIRPIKGYLEWAIQWCDCRELNRSARCISLRGRVMVCTTSDMSSPRTQTSLARLFHNTPRIWHAPDPGRAAFAHRSQTARHQSTLVGYNLLIDRSQTPISTHLTLVGHNLLRDRSQTPSNPHLTLVLLRNRSQRHQSTLAWPWALLSDRIGRHSSNSHSLRLVRFFCNCRSAHARATHRIE